MSTVTSQLDLRDLKLFPVSQGNPDKFTPHIPKLNQCGEAKWTNWAVYSASGEKGGRRGGVGRVGGRLGERLHGNLQISQPTRKLPSAKKLGTGLLFAMIRQNSIFLRRNFALGKAILKSEPFMLWLKKEHFFKKQLWYKCSCGINNSRNIRNKKDIKTWVIARNSLSLKKGTQNNPFLPTLQPSAIRVRKCEIQLHRVQILLAVCGQRKREKREREREREREGEESPHHQKNRTGDRSKERDHQLYTDSGQIDDAWWLVGWPDAANFFATPYFLETFFSFSRRLYIYEFASISFKI